MSLYLTEGIQDPDGQYFLRKPVRAAGVPVGTIKTVRDGNHTVDRVSVAFMEEPDANFFCHPMVLGDNLYRQAHSCRTAALSIVPVNRWGGACVAQSMLLQQRRFVLFWGLLGSPPCTCRKDRIAVMPPPRSAFLDNQPSGKRSSTDNTSAVEHKPSAYSGKDEPGQLQPTQKCAAAARNKALQNTGDADVTARGEVQLLSALSSIKVRNEAAKLDLFIEDDAIEEPPPQEPNVVRVGTAGRGAYSSHLEGMASIVESGGTNGGALDLLAMMDHEAEG